MKEYLKKIIIRRILYDQQPNGPDGTFSDYQVAKGFWELRLTVIRGMKDTWLVLIGIFAAAFGFKGFLLTNSFIDGGATGISLLIAALTEMPLYFLIICVNIPFMFLAYTVIGQRFAIKTALAITGLSIVLATVDFPEVTEKDLLVAVFGGFFLGAGIGLSVRGGAVIDGTEVLAIFLSRKFGVTIGDIIMIINIFIFSAAAWLLSVDTALYSMITYLVASKTVNFVVEGIEEYTGVTIISSHSEEIRQMIIHKMGHGVTVYKGKRGFGKRGETSDTDIIYTVITRLELSKLNSEIEKIDSDAFIVMSRVKDTRGGMIKKRPLKH